MAARTLLGARAGLCALAATFLLAASGPAPAAEAAPVDVALVLAVDVSGSVDAQEYELQHEGIARAFESKDVVATIANGAHGAIAALLLEWSDRDKQVITVDWRRISDAATAADFAARVRASTRSSSGLTAIGDALLASGAAFARLGGAADRRVIDLSGDGMANIGPPPDQVRDGLVADGITINGLAILKTEPWLDGYYDQNVVGGEHSFLLKVEDFQSFATAIQQKLLGEIAALPSHTAAGPSPASAGEGL
jgi:class 3 adenylate cyclase